MLIKNTDQRYGRIAVLLHWLMAVIVLGLLTLGLYMVRLPIGLEKLKLYGWHKEYGLLVLGLILLRLLWRLYNITPRLALPSWEKAAARVVHWLLYALMILMPLTGWLLTSAAGLRPAFFGLITLPALIAPDEALRNTFGTLHEIFAWSLIGLILLHTAAALKHHFIDRDDILRRMF